MTNCCPSNGCSYTDNPCRLRPVRGQAAPSSRLRNCTLLSSYSTVPATTHQSIQPGVQHTAAIIMQAALQVLCLVRKGEPQLNCKLQATAHTSRLHQACTATRRHGCGSTRAHNSMADPNTGNTTLANSRLAAPQQQTLALSPLNWKQCSTG
jgi:hypothetical protein